MDILDIDVETYCDLDLTKIGSYKYVAHASFAIVLLSFSFNGGPTRAIDVYQQPLIPAALRSKILDPNVLIRAHNWTFERLALSKHLGIEIPAWRGRCSMIKSASMGLPLKLEQLGKALQLVTQKDSRGKGYMNYFSKPCKPTKTNGQRIRNLPEHAPGAWNGYKIYNIKDVDTEIAVEDALSFYELPDVEWEYYYLDQKINDHGILVDAQLIRNAIRMYRAYIEKSTISFVESTGISNPKSIPQLKKWILDKTGITIKSLNKDVIEAVRLQLKDYPEALAMLKAREAFMKTSVGKYAAMYRLMGADNRIKGAHQHRGAGRTGRSAGRGLQPHNMPRNKLKREELQYVRNLIKNGHFDVAEMMYDVPTVLSELLRTCIIAPPDKILAVADFTSIEAVIISWLAGEKWRLDAFKRGQDIYKASASQMFNIPIDAVSDEDRQRGKVSELSLGFQGSVGALIRMGAVKMGIPESELMGLVHKWRARNPAIVKMWRELQELAMLTVKRGIKTSFRGLITMFMSHGRFVIKLPSGRCLFYHNAAIKRMMVYYDGPENPGTLKEVICYEGLNEKGQWITEPTYGGKITENIVQAIAADILFVAMRRLDKRGYTIPMHVHDEVVMEIDNPKSDREVRAVLDEINNIMSIPIKWAKDAPISAKTFLSPYYKKD